MNLSSVIYFMQLVLAAIAERDNFTNLTINANAINERKMEEGEPLAMDISDLFRRNLQVGAGQTPKTLDQNKLLLIRGAKFRTVSVSVLKHTLCFLDMYPYTVFFLYSEIRRVKLESRGEGQARSQDFGSREYLV